MKADAEKYAEEDKQKKETIETRNEVDTLTYQLEKLVEENKDNIQDEDTKRAVEVCEDAKKLLETPDSLKETLEESKKNIMELLQKIGSQLQQQSQEQPEVPETESHNTDDVVDADFEVVDDKE